ncbi:Anaerobic glycerol-3-phosphate dehydrogenase subunit B [hydrothermal vent metagenome]|uniref:Anaerobic glycerol-3-phosphate dehydrogenase subunit B n=1 Tax=hydrothermal vent metagenome TaxID=652676 RepID=A0A3B0UIJ5_9ZZZZ
MSRHNDVLVMGAGLGGLTAVWQLTTRQKKARLISKGWGATHWHSGCIDVLGYYPVDQPEPVASPGVTLAKLIVDQPNHPYALVGLTGIEAALEAFKGLCDAAGYPLHGSLDKNWLLPSAVGTFRPTCLAPETMIAGDLSRDEPMLIVGMRQLVDFYPNLVAENLTKQGVAADYLMLDMPELAQRNFTTPVLLASLMEQPSFRAELVQRIKPKLGKARRVGLPAVLGRQPSLLIKNDLEAQLGVPVFEIPGLPPSLPGMRLHAILMQVIEQAGGRIYQGMEGVGFASEDGRVTAVFTEAAVRKKAHRFNQYVLATGGILGGGINTSHRGKVREQIFNLPIAAPKNHLDWFEQDFLDPKGHPIYRAGVTVNGRFQPTNGDNQPIFENVYAAGTTLAHCDLIRERSFEGVALATGFAVGNLLV